MDNETLQTLTKKLLSTLDGCIEFLEDTAKELNDDFKEAVSASEEDLPLLIINNEWAGKRVKGEDLLDPETLIDVLANEAMEADVYRRVGMNDGELYVLMDIFEILGMEEEKKKAFAYIYRA